MRRFLILLALALVLSACSVGGGTTTTTIERNGVTKTSTDSQALPLALVVGGSGLVSVLATSILTYFISRASARQVHQHETARSALVAAREQAIEADKRLREAVVAASERVVQVVSATIRVNNAVSASGTLEAAEYLDQERHKVVDLGEQALPLVYLLDDATLRDLAERVIGGCSGYLFDYAESLSNATDHPDPEACVLGPRRSFFEQARVVLQQSAGGVATATAALNG